MFAPQVLRNCLVVLWEELGFSGRAGKWDSDNLVSDLDPAGDQDPSEYLDPFMDLDCSKKSERKENHIQKSLNLGKNLLFNLLRTAILLPDPEKDQDLH